jgi:hypothetical protein
VAIAVAIAAAAASDRLFITAAAIAVVRVAVAAMTTMTTEATAATALTAAAAVTGHCHVVGAHQGQTDHREKNRDAKNQSSIHLGSSKLRCPHVSEIPKTQPIHAVRHRVIPEPDGENRG